MAFMDQFRQAPMQATMQMQAPQQAPQQMGLDPRAIFMQMLGANPQNMDYLRANQHKTLGQICREMGISL